MISQTDPNQSAAYDVKGMDQLRQSARANDPQALKQAATQFEALFINMMMKSMREASPQDGMLDSQQSKLYTSMLDQQTSQNLAKRGTGLADMLIRQMSQSGDLSAAADGTPGGSTLNAALEAFRRQGGIGARPAVTLPAEAAAAADADALPLSAQAGKSGASQAPHVRAFRDKLGAHAEEASRATGVPAKFMLGQAALESGWGKHEIRARDGSPSHNLFGIKAGADWKGKVVSAVTTEYVNGTPHTKVEKFRAYASYADSFKDYAALLTNNKRYEKVLASAGDASSFAQGLQRAGYATDPHYATKLTRIIQHSLIG